MDKERYVCKTEEEKYLAALVEEKIEIPRKIIIDGFPKGNLFTRIHPDYRSFEELYRNLKN